MSIENCARERGRNRSGCGGYDSAIPLDAHAFILHPIFCRISINSRVSVGCAQNTPSIRSDCSSEELVHDLEVGGVGGRSGKPCGVNSSPDVHAVPVVNRGIVLADLGTGTEPELNEHSVGDRCGWGRRGRINAIFRRGRWFCWRSSDDEVAVELVSQSG